MTTSKIYLAIRCTVSIIAYLQAVVARTNLDLQQLWLFTSKLKNIPKYWKKNAIFAIFPRLFAR
ncbi:MAG: hypothetical protein WBM38_09735, partial [Arenicellales bacterium]